jgi:hypothetical protein
VPKRSERPGGGRIDECTHRDRSAIFPATAIAFIGAAPAYACVGFESPLADGPVTVRGNRALPLKAELDQDGLALTDADLSASPVVQVDYHSGSGGTPGGCHR